jgi:hypothetical protein
MYAEKGISCSLVPITALFETTPKSSTRQMTINTQNMIVFTVEFTRTPFCGQGKNCYAESAPPILH